MGYTPHEPMTREEKEKRRRTRLNWIFSRLITDGRATAVALQKECHVTDRTARTDIFYFSALLREMKRTRGGMAQVAPVFYSESARLESVEAKQDVATIAANAFTPGTSIAAATGSTVAMTYASLLDQGIGCAVVTNSLSITEHATQGFPIYLVGGEYSQHIH